MMSPRTIFLRRLIGLYYLFVTLAMIIRKQSAIECITEIVHSPSASFLVGLFGVATCLAIVLAHNVWKGGALPVFVTLIGWITLTKSLLILYLTPQMEAELFLKRLHYQQFFYFYMALSLAIGIYLTYGGFGPARKS
jgi:hypothetical protein